MKDSHQSYKVKSNNFEFDFDNSEIDSADVIALSKNELNIIIDNISYNIEITKDDFNAKKYKIQIENEIFEVEIKDELDQLIEALGFETKQTIQLNNIKAPMPGLVLEIAVKVDQEIAQGDKLIVLEAMKMENIIKIAHSGKIKEILVEKGQAVEKGQVLIEFYSTI